MGQFMSDFVPDLKDVFWDIRILPFKQIGLGCPK